MLVNTKFGKILPIRKNLGEWFHRQSSSHGNYLFWRSKDYLEKPTGAYALTELELDAINSRFGEPMSGDLLESVLSDLYSEEEQAEIEEVEEDDGASTEDN